MALDLLRMAQQDVTDRCNAMMQDIDEIVNQEPQLKKAFDAFKARGFQVYVGGPKTRMLRYIDCLQLARAYVNPKSIPVHEWAGLVKDMPHVGMFGCRFTEDQLIDAQGHVLYSKEASRESVVAQEKEPTRQ